MAVGRAFRDSEVPREEIFVITKIYPGEQFANPEKAIQDALDKLDIDYIDMMLLHHPGTNDVKAYLAMEKYVDDGKIHFLGLSNFYVEELEEFLPQVNITPALVQNEIHPYYQENDVIPYIQNLGIVVQGWYPFGGRGHTSELLGDSVISNIAKAHGVTSAQVILRWNLQKGVVVIPGSSNPGHIWWAHSWARVNLRLPQSLRTWPGFTKLSSRRTSFFFNGMILLTPSSSIT